METDFTWLQETWFVLITALLAGYAVLDGFDLGVGILHPLARSDRERRTFIGAIGPIWDGNEVWLITFGGALFAAFPYAYASIFSGFYTAFMILLFALIYRAVSIEFRSKMKPEAWRRFWDGGFFISSFLATLLFGVAVGNAIIGIPIDVKGDFLGSFWTLLQPYSVMTGLLSVAMFAMHGSLFLVLKTPEGELHDRLRRWVWHTWGVFLVIYILTTMYTLIAVERAVPNFEAHPWVAVIVLVNVLAIANIPRSAYANRPGQAFISSCVTIVALIALFGLALWPNLVTASNDPANSLTLSRAASSERTLWIMLIVAMIGMPLVLTYTTTIYWTFRGKVEVSETGY